MPLRVTTRFPPITRLATNRLPQPDGPIRYCQESAVVVGSGTLLAVIRPQCLGQQRRPRVRCDTQDSGHRDGEGGVAASAVQAGEAA